MDLFSASCEVSVGLFIAGAALSAVNAFTGLDLPFRQTKYGFYSFFSVFNPKRTAKIFSEKGICRETFPIVLFNLAGLGVLMTLGIDAYSVLKVVPTPAK